MKDEKQSWSNYLSEVNYGDANDYPEYRVALEARDIEIDKIRDIAHKCEPYLKESYKAVKDRTYPRAVIKEKTRKFFGSDKYPPYSFRLQCLITGKCSTLIKEDDYPKYGILRSDTHNGGDFRSVMNIKNKLQVVIDYKTSQYEKINDRIHKIDQTINDTRLLLIINTKALWFQRYSEYLYSDEWSAIRNKALQKDNNKCLQCQSETALQVHHLTYENVGNETLEELITLCTSCHKNIHQIDYNDRLEIERICTEQRQLNKEL